MSQYNFLQKGNTQTTVEPCSVKSTLNGVAKSIDPRQPAQSAQAIFKFYACQSILVGCLTKLIKFMHFICEDLPGVIYDTISPLLPEHGSDTGSNTYMYVCFFS